MALWRLVFAEPEAVAGHVARVAVAEAGGAAWAWAEGERAKYPAAPAVTLASGAHTVVRHRFLYGGPTRARGAFTPADAVTEWLELAWCQASLVLHVAAGYGTDPRAPERAADVLALWRVRGGVPEAREVPPPTDDRLREVTPDLAMALGRLTGRVKRGATAFEPDPSWGYVANTDARTLRPLANRAMRLFG